MDWQDFLAAPIAEVAQVAPRTMVYTMGGTRRSAALAGIVPESDAYIRWTREQLVAGLDLLFRYGVEHVFVAAITPDPAGRLICVGIAAFLFFQTTVSVGMNVQVVPVTGLTLPFVSYGGSALVTLFIGIGVVQSILMRHRKQEFG